MSLSQRSDLDVDVDLAARGREIAIEGAWSSELGVSCVDCHETLGQSFEVSEDGSGYPDLAEYLSAQWLHAFLNNPGSEQFYGDKNHMPAYADKLTESERRLLVRWLTGDYFPPENHEAEESGEGS